MECKQLCYFSSPLGTCKKPHGVVCPLEVPIVVVDGKIVEITTDELFSLYLKRGMEDAMDFNEFRNRFEAAGCVVKET